MFEKGQSGNPGGRPKEEKIFRAALLTALKRTDGDMTKIARVANALVDKACEGDVPAAREIMDRVDGKTPMPVEHSGEIEHNHIARIPSPSNDITQWQSQQAAALITQR